MVLLPNATLEQALIKAENLRATVAALTVRAQGKAVEPVTISIGVSAFPQHGTNADELIRAADAALYRAKHAGRNRALAAE